MINHDTMTELEMVSSYRQAASKAKQIRVLADLGLCSAEEIIEMLRRHGETVRSRTIRTLYADGAIPLLPDDPPEPEPEPEPEPAPEPVSNLDTGYGEYLFSAECFDVEPENYDLEIQTLSKSVRCVLRWTSLID